MSNPNFTNDVSEITILKESFQKKLNDGDPGVYNLIEDMRKIHARCMIKFLDSLMMAKQSPNPDLVLISTNSSLIHIIHSCIRNCEKTIYQKGIEKSSKDIQFSDLLTSESDDKNIQSKGENFYSKNDGIDIYISDNGTIRVNGLETTDVNSLPQMGGRYNDDEDEDDDDESMLGGDNLTEFINNLTTERASKLLKDIMPVQKSSNGMVTSNVHSSGLDPNKPTFVLYYASWCGASTASLPHWNNAANLLKNIQCVCFDIGHDEERKRIASAVGITSLPTLVYYDGKGGRKIVKVGMLTDKNDIMRLVQ